MPRIIATVVVVVIALAVRYFTVGSDDVVKFNDKMVELTEDVVTKYGPFQEQVGNYTAGQSVDAASMKQALAAAQSQAKPYVDQIKAYAVPDNELCRNFHNSITAIADAYASHQGSFDSIVSYVEAHNQPAEDDVNHVTELIATFETEMFLKLNVMMQAQKTMCDKYDITLQ